MGWTVGIPSLKLNKAGTKSKHCGDFASVAAEALKERKGHDPDINPELAAKNVYEGFETAEELLAYSDERCSSLRDGHGRGLRKDAVRMCATILKPPAAYMATLSEEDQRRFLDDGVEKIREIVGADNVKAVAYHFDEQGAHVHVFWEPMTEDGRLCAKELHGLRFFSRLNKEMPEHLRSRGWDIDDCKAYDAAQEALKSEKEKAERRQKNGRSSAVYKAEAQKELNELNLQIAATYTGIEGTLQDILDETMDAVAESETGVFDDVMYLMVRCSDERFEELCREGEDLKRQDLRQEAEKQQKVRSLADKIRSADSVRKKDMTWQEQCEMWEAYRVVSRDFWDMRAVLSEEYNQELREAYGRKRDALRSYYDALYLLRRSRDPITLMIAVILAFIAMAREDALVDQINDLQNKRQELIQNTATFKKYSNTYREDLKAGKMPFDEYLTSMSLIAARLDKEAEKFEQRSQSINRGGTPVRSAEGWTSK